MGLEFSYLPELELLAQLKNNPQNEVMFKKQVQQHKQLIFEEMSLLYNDSAHTQEDVDNMIESLITKVAELSIAGHILDKLVGDFSQWIDLEELDKKA